MLALRQHGLGCARNRSTGLGTVRRLRRRERSIGRRVHQFRAYCRIEISRPLSMRCSGMLLRAPIPGIQALPETQQVAGLHFWVALSASGCGPSTESRLVLPLFVKISPTMAGNIECLAVIDEFTNECLAIRVARKLKAIDVIDVLSDLFILRGVPGHIRSDNGPEFVAKAVQEWITAVGAKTAYITLGSPGRTETRELQRTLTR